MCHILSSFHNTSGCAIYFPASATCGIVHQFEAQNIVSNPLHYEKYDDGDDHENDGDNDDDDNDDFTFFSCSTTATMFVLFVRPRSKLACEAG